MNRSLGLILALVTTAGGTVAHADDPRKIAESTEDRWNQAFAAGQVDQIGALYADNAMLVQPNGVVSRDTTEIRTVWQT